MADVQTCEVGLILGPTNIV